MTERFCAKCGKLFIPAPLHRFVDKKGIYCSWTCYNHRNDARPPKKWKGVEQYNLRGELLQTYTSATDAAEKTGFLNKKIQQACRLNARYCGFLWKYQTKENEDESKT